MLVILCTSFQTVALSGTGLFLPEINKDLGLSFTEGGMLSAASLFIYAAMQIPGGYLADRFGSRKVLFIGALGTTLTCLTFGFISNYWQGVTNQAVSGFFRSLLFVPSMAFLACWFSPNRRATAMGLTPAGAFLGQAFMFSIGPSLAHGADWRFPFIIFGMAGILISAAFFLFGKEPPTAVATQKTKLSDIGKLFRHPLIWVFGAIQFVRYGTFQGIMLWLPSLLIDKASLFGNDSSIALKVIGYLMAVRAIVTAPSNIIGGFVSDKIQNPIFVMRLSLVIMAVTTALLLHVNNLTLLIAVIAVNALFAHFYSGPLYSMAVDVYGRHIIGLVTGISNLFANLGSVSIVYLLGWLKDVTGSFSPGFYTMSFACIIGLIFTVLLEHMRSKAPKDIE